MKKFFQVLEKSKKSQARLGKIQTEHGVIKTPAFVPVATKGTVKSLTPKQIKEIGVQVSFVNTYHLVIYPGVDIIEKSGGIHQMAKLDYPLMSDSGGFQVFSLARNNRAQFRNFLSPHSKKANVRGEEQPLVIKIDENGVIFRSTYDGKTIEFTPEKSMEYQKKIGADLNMAFDECTYYPATHEYAEKAMERTHQWLERCVSYKRTNYQVPSSNEFSNSNEKMKIVNSLKNENCKLKTNQYLYGIIQGATFEDLRKKSAKFIASQPVDGVAIGGVSVGETKKEMRDQVKWVADYLPKDKPVHLLGVGQFDDIIDLVKYGIDTFDCVEPTRLARMGIIYQSGRGLSRFFSRQCSGEPARCRDPLNLDTRPQKIDINKNTYNDNLEPVDKNCQCWVCQNFSKAYLHHLFKQREILGYTLATYHNLFIMERFMELIRQAIEKNQL